MSPKDYVGPPTLANDDVKAAHNFQDNTNNNMIMKVNMGSGVAE